MPTTTTPRANRPPRPDGPLLGVWAHPDDESYLAAGLMGRYADRGARVTSVTATLGELGFADDDERTHDQRRVTRAAELQNALGVVGVDDLRVLGIPDGGCADAPRSALVDAIARVMVEIDPVLTVTFGPDGITGHADHIAVGAATTDAWRHVGRGGLLYATKTKAHLREFADLHRQLRVFEVEPRGVHERDLALSCRLSGAEVERKRIALAAHASQTTAIATAMGEHVYRRWWAHEAFRSPCPQDVQEFSRNSPHHLQDT